MGKEIVVDPVTRLEGHNTLKVKLGDDGSVQDVQFNITTTRFFEKFLEGRYCEHIPRITPRICGICPIPHHLASVKAVESAWDVTPPPAAIKLRRLMIEAKQFSSHTIHFYALAAPDFVYGPFANPADRNVAAVLRDLPDVAVQAIKMMEFGQELIKTIGAKAVHPTTGIPGGMLTSFKEDDRDFFLGRLEEIQQRGAGSARGDDFWPGTQPAACDERRSVVTSRFIPQRYNPDGIHPDPPLTRKTMSPRLVFIAYSPDSSTPSRTISSLRKCVAQEIHGSYARMSCSHCNVALSCSILVN